MNIKSRELDRTTPVTAISMQDWNPCHRTQGNSDFNCWWYIQRTLSDELQRLRDDLKETGGRWFNTMFPGRLQSRSKKSYCFRLQCWSVNTKRVFIRACSGAIQREYQSWRSSRPQRRMAGRCLLCRNERELDRCNSQYHQCDRSRNHNTPAMVNLTRAFFQVMLNCRSQGWFCQHACICFTWRRVT